MVSASPGEIRRAMVRHPDDNGQIGISITTTGDSTDLVPSDDPGALRQKRSTLIGAETALEGHSDGVRALCVLPDGRLASGSDVGPQHRRRDCTPGDRRADQLRDRPSGGPPHCR